MAPLGFTYLGGSEYQHPCGLMVRQLAYPGYGGRRAKQIVRWRLWDYGAPAESPFVRGAQVGDFAEPTLVALAQRLHDAGFPRGFYATSR